MCSARDSAALPALGCPIRESAGQRLLNASPRLFAVVHALHRLLVPRQPPCALNILTVSKKRIPNRHPLSVSRRTTRERVPAGAFPVSLALALRFSRAAERRGRGLRPQAVSQNSAARGSQLESHD